MNDFKWIKTSDDKKEKYDKFLEKKSINDKFSVGLRYNSLELIKEAVKIGFNIHEEQIEIRILKYEFEDFYDVYYKQNTPHNYVEIRKFIPKEIFDYLSEIL